MDCAVRMLLDLLWSVVCVDKKRDQEFQITSVYIINALYEICYGHCHVEYPRHLFLRNAMLMISSDLRMMPMFSENVLIHVICHSASSSNQIDFVDELPRSAVCVHSLPLIRGYIRSECDSSLYIPDSIVTLMI